MTGSHVPAAFRVIGNAPRHLLGRRLLVDYSVTVATSTVYFGLHEVPDVVGAQHRVTNGPALYLGKAIL